MVKKSYPQPSYPQIEVLRYLNIDVSYTYVENNTNTNASGSIQ